MTVRLLEHPGGAIVGSYPSETEAHAEAKRLREAQAKKGTPWHALTRYRIAPETETPSPEAQPLSKRGRTKNPE